MSNPIGLLALSPAPPLKPYIHGYWFVQDMDGRHEGQAISTNAHPGAVFTVNIGRPNAMIGGPVVPPVSLLGVQTEARGWRSWSETYFVMSMLTLQGVARLFPQTGAATANTLLDLAAVYGDRRINALAADVSAAWTPRNIASLLDRWFMNRLACTPQSKELPLVSAAHELLRAGAGVEAASTHVGVGRRQLGRWYKLHFGVGPQTLFDLERLQLSVSAVQRTANDAMVGFSDQPHQIRTWRRRLDMSPGRYRRQRPSLLADFFRRSGADAPVFYL